MKRHMDILSSFIVGLIFGIGLILAGMTDPSKVIGFLDVAGLWDPSLAFVMGGAILPMAVAWRLHGVPPVQGAALAPDLIAGSILFGIGWGLAGFCPGPAMASVSFGGTGGAVFLLAMAAGMFAQPALRRLWPLARPA